MMTGPFFAALLASLVAWLNSLLEKVVMVMIVPPLNVVMLLHTSNKGNFQTPDGYIAAIAASRGFIVASRDTAPYQAVGVSVINPWEQ
jgi:hypothetical protein